MYNVYQCENCADFHCTICILMTASFFYFIITSYYKCEACFSFLKISGAWDFAYKYRVVKQTSFCSMFYTCLVETRQNSLLVQLDFYNLIVPSLGNMLIMQSDTFMKGFISFFVSINSLVFIWKNKLDKETCILDKTLSSQQCIH